VEYLDRVLREKQDLLAPPPTKGRMISFLPAGGGSGASTVSTHVAAAIARLTSTRALLLDWDLHCGTTAFRLRLKPEFTLGDALERASALDEFWKKLVCPWKGIDLLPPAPPVGLTAEDFGRLPAVLASARRNYEWIVCDMPAAVFSGFEPALLESDAVYLVCTPDIVSLHLARRRFEELCRLGISQETVQLVVNREVSNTYRPEEIRKLVGIPVARTLPNDYRSVNSAWVEGRLVPEGSDLGRPLQKFAQDLVGKSDRTERREPSRGWKPAPRVLEVTA
jgi:pilus assembly protein CpaE